MVRNELRTLRDAIVGWVTCKVRRGTRREGGLGRYPRGPRALKRSLTEKG